MCIGDIEGSTEDGVFEGEFQIVAQVGSSLDPLTTRTAAPDRKSVV